MKKIYISLSLIILAQICIGQNDKKFGEIFNKKADSKIENAISNNKSLCGATKLPSHVDNSLNKYFPLTISQIGGSCAMASGVGYVYTYEMNFLLDRDGKKLENNFAYMQMWNYLNEGTGKGSFAPDGWDLIQDNGVAPASIFNIKSTDAGAKTQWLSGYDKYFEAMHYRVKSKAKFVPYPDGYKGDFVNVIPSMKQYLFDHANGSKVGGLIVFTAYADPLDCDKNYKGPSETGYKSIIAFFPKTGAHAMCFVGYDDKVEFDINKNGTIEDDEKGAFVAMNSWGANWGDKGRYYVPYKLIKLKKGSEGGTGTGSKNCYIVTPEYRKPKLTFKATISHISRNDIAIKIGVSTKKNATGPEIIKDKTVMYHQGGDLYMQGIASTGGKEIEIGIDASEFSEYIGEDKNATFFFEIVDKTFGKAGEGRLTSCSLIDYTLNPTTPKQYLSKISNPKIFENNTTIATISYGNVIIKEGRYFGFEYEFNNSSKKGLLKIANKENIQINISLVNSKGELVKDLSNKEIKSGESTQEYDLSDIKPGSYAIKMMYKNQLNFKPFNIK